MHAKLILCLWTVFVLNAAVSAQQEKLNQTQQIEFVKKSTATGVISFALTLTNKLYNDSSSDNLIFSPLSIFSALCISHLAASGVTRDEIADAIRLPKEESEIPQLHEVMGEFFKYLQQPNFANVSIANGFFVHNSVAMAEDFVEKVLRLYGSEISSVDFTKGRVATDYINQWIKEKTQGRISELYKDQIPETTRIALASSLYFSGRWESPFNSQDTTIETFNTGSEVIDVRMMNNQKELYYLNYPAGVYEAIALPYDNEEFIMYIAMPYANYTLKDMLDRLTIESLYTAVKFAVKANVDYKIPRLKFGWSASIKQQLRSLGINKFFEKADLNNMIPSMDLSVSDVNHGADIDIDEWGTEASAATGVTFNTYSAKFPPRDSVKFYLNRPFMFFICQRQTSAVLFSAVVRRPPAATDPGFGQGP